MDKRNLTIGFIIPNLVGDYHIQLWGQVNNLAIKYGIDLITFTPFISRSQSSSIDDYISTFKLGNKKNLDGLIVSTGSMNGFLSSTQIKEVFDYHNDLPVVSIAYLIESVPSVIIDNKTGMKELINHFIEVHNYKNIAFIRGPLEHQEADLRYQAYVETFYEHGIPLREELVVVGDFSIISGRNGIITLIDKRNVTFDAIIATNDDMAIGAHMELQKRGIKISEEVGLGGFDNMQATNALTPTITTVEQPFQKQIETALEILLKSIDNKEVPPVTLLPSVPVIKESCGCIPQQLFEEKDCNDNQSVYDVILKNYNVDSLSPISAIILGCLSVEDLCAKMSILRKEIAIPTIVVALYNNGDPVVIESTGVIPEKSRAVFITFGNQEIGLDENGIVYDTEELFPPGLDFKKDRSSYYCSEILFNDNHFGYLLLQYDDLDPLLFQFLVLQLSNTFQFIHIHKKLDTMNKELIEKNMFKSRYLANMSHEIRTPLNSILGHTQSLQYGAFNAKDQIAFIHEELIDILGRIHDKKTCEALDTLLIISKDFDDKICNTDEELGYFYIIELNKAFSKLKKDIGNGFHDEIIEIEHLILEMETAIKTEVRLNHESILSIREGGEYLLELINAILDLSKIESGKADLNISLIQLAPFLENIFNEVQSYNKAKRKDDSVKIFMYKGELPKDWSCDSSKIKQVLLNLLSNAVKYTLSGSITFIIEFVHDTLIFKVRDTGIGIKETEYENLFVEFSRIEATKDIEGTGLGLALTKRLVEMHHGTIAINKEYNDGTEFIVCLPVINQ